MKFNFTIDSDNAAFAATEDAALEISTIMAAVSVALMRGHTTSKLWDTNGNECGAWSFEPSEPESKASGR